MEDILRNEIIKNCLERKSLIVDPNKIDSSKLQGDENFKETNSSEFEINLESESNKLSILSIAIEKLGYPVPTDISEAVKFIHDFEEELKKPETNVSWAGLIELKHAMTGFVLAEIHNEGKGNLVDFVLNRLKNKHKDEVHLRNIEAYFFEALITIEMTAKEFFETIRSYNSTVSKTNISYRALTFAQKIGQQKTEVTKQLYEEIISCDNWENEFGVLPAHLLLGIHKTDPNYSFKKANEELASHPVHSLFVFGRIDFSNETEFQDILKIIEELNPKDEQTVNQLIYLLTSILKSKFVTDVITKFCFQQFQDLFNSETLNNKVIVVDAMINWIENYEKERYGFLLKNHGEFGDFKLIESYFSRFKDSIFFFDFFQKVYHAFEGKMKPGLFGSVVNHFSREDTDKTERSILDFLSHKEIFWRKAGMHLIETKDIGVHQPNLLRLETEIAQLRALEILTEYNWNLEEYLPMVLVLRNSHFPSVKKELQKVLAKLTYESYYEVLVEKVSNLLTNSAEDKRFIRPLKEALKKYHKLVEFKSSIKDLNPFENERNYMDLYYRLEHENQAKMMKEIKSGKGNFLTSFFKSSIIVRGHSWKLEEKNEVVPLAKIEHSFSIDARAFKNSELFEHQYNHYKSKY
ncbi:MAG TPA: hypothetical protein VK151_02820 [Fluviicola sp.]|nr:hypothetical protein [Fluviicola sp.]